MSDQDQVADGTAVRNTSGDGVDSFRPEPGLSRDLTGQILGDRYELREQIGSGAFAVTFHGRDLRLDRSVAIKILRQTYAADMSFVRRFEREAKAAASVTQSNVVAVYDVGRQGDHLYIVMQYIEGEDLKHLIAREGPLTPQRAVTITLDILAGLAAIHEAGIIHRDIKPQNVLIGRDGIARVTDFGIARLSEEAGLTTVGTVMGTAAYMAPEQAEAQPLVKATDLYAVGIVLYEMLTGHLPFEASTTFALILAHLQSTPSPPSFRAPTQDIDPALDAVVLQALAKHPDDRFADARTMARALAAVVEQQPMRSAMVSAVADEDTVRTRTLPFRAASTTWPAGPARPDERRVRLKTNGRRRVQGRRWLVPLAALLLLIGGGAGIGLFVRNLNDGEDPPGGDPQMEAFLDPSATAEGTVSSTGVDTPVPTQAPTFTPAPTATASSTEPPTSTALPTPTEAPTSTVIPTPTEAADRSPTDPPQVIMPVATQSLTDAGIAETQAADANLSSDNRDGDGTTETMTFGFTAADWQGAYFQQTGNLQPWSAVYAQSTGYGSAQVSFTLNGVPATDTFVLTVDGMTSENWSNLPISIQVNGQEVFQGASPFPTWNGVEGQQPWTTVSVELPASALRAGENTVAFVNQVGQGDFSRPPYILLAGATVTVEIQASD
jgi:predicted Ser/Thr protein kinase